MEMAGFVVEIAAGVTSARQVEIDARKAWLNETIPSFKVILLFNTLYSITQGKGGFSSSFGYFLTDYLHYYFGDN